MDYFLRRDTCLTIFDEGGAADAAAAPDSSQSGKSGEVKVVYGKQTAETKEGPDAGGKETNPAETPEQRKARFKALVTGEFKDVYTEETQRIIDRRFKDTKGLEDALSAHQPVLDMLSQRYGVTDGDVTKIAAAIEADDAYWRDAAEDAGMEVAQYKQMQKLARENEQFKRTMRERQGQEQMRQQLETWDAEAEAVKQEYPDFDLQGECGNKEFIAMLKAGVPVKHAYEVVHLDDVKGSLEQKTAQRTEKAVVDNIRAKGTRPTENGAASQSGIIVKSDASKFTPKDRREIVERMKRGEQIVL